MTSIQTLMETLVIIGCPTIEPEDKPAPTDDLFEVELTLSEEIPTVVTATWEVAIDDITSAKLEFGRDTTYGHLAPAEVTNNGAEYECVLWGMKGHSPNRRLTGCGIFLGLRRLCRCICLGILVRPSHVELDSRRCLPTELWRHASYILL
ncbi:MAG: hypothetical protein HN348_14010, partial [Proteobacteria bacterium]|nr:hypothetical protein [Pseudomonadota bacterium]